MSSIKPSSDAPITNDTNDDTPSPTHQLIQEGQITMLYPQSENSVFYNPVQVQNRDLSILMIGMYAERRCERLWVAKRRKEVRRDLLEQSLNNSNDGVGVKDKKEETKDERKAKTAQLEKDINEQIQKERASIDFTKLTKESSSTTNDDGGGGLTILDALAASGLRSLRYWKEIPGVRTVVVNDLDPVAVELARENVGRNGFENDLVKEEDYCESLNGGGINGANVDGEEGGENNKLSVRPRGIILQVGDATHEMYMSRIPPNLYAHQQTASQRRHQKPQYDVIDLDPYGSASPFLDSAIQAVVNGGLLAVTCTDMAALGGSHPETCYGRYGAFPVQRSGYLQELALRILLYQMSVVAGRYGRTIRPVLSVGMAFYCRVFVEVYDDKAGVSNE
jgi:tRNA (guanine26-N2/guanine27-N2)-dimethyltransferase